MGGLLRCCMHGSLACRRSWLRWSLWLWNLLCCPSCCLGGLLHLRGRMHSLWDLLW